MADEISADLITKAANTAGLVAYQKNSIVSRQIIKQKTGNVTLFAFDLGQELTEHTSPCDAIILVLDGTAEIYIDGKPHVVKKRRNDYHAR